MALSDLRSIQAGLDIGNSIGQPIAQGLLQKYQRENALKQLLLSNPDIASGIVKPQLDANGGPVQNDSFINIGGKTFDPAAIKKAQIEDETRKFENQLKVSQALAGMRGTGLQIIQDPTTGAVFRIEKSTGNVLPTQQPGQSGGGTFNTGVKTSVTELIDPATGSKYKVNIDPSGKIVSDLGTSEIAKGTPVIDPVSGKVSLVNTALPNGTAPGQAADVSTGALQPNQSTSFKVGVKPTQANQVSDSATQKIGAYDSLLDQYQAIEDAYKKAPESIGPVAGRVSGAKSKFGGIIGIPKNTPAQADLLSKINSVRAEAVHEKYGGALSPQELGFANQFIINQRNPDVDFESNLKAAIQTIKSQRGTLINAEKNKGANVEKFEQQNVSSNVSNEFPPKGTIVRSKKDGKAYVSDGTKLSPVE